MIFGSLTFAARDWFWPAVVLFALGCFFVWVSYSRVPLQPRFRFLSAFLKLLGLALLLVCLLEPLWTSTRPREGANFFAIVADNSMGMQIRDSGATASRGELLRQVLTSDQSPWQALMEQTFMVRRYFFDTHLQSTPNFGDLAFEGRSSAIAGAMKSISERFTGQPLAGILLFTDGNGTDIPEEGLKLGSLPPIYPVLIGEKGDHRDLSISRVSVSQTAFEDAPVTIQANLAAEGLAGLQATAQLISNGKVVEEQTIDLKKNSEELALRFQTKPTEPGISFYKLRVDIKGASSETEEATTHNNVRTVPVDRGKGPYRILYVGGRPSWEYKFLNRALSEDPEVQLVGLIRIARREPKFTFRGRTGESSNPLFRGFNKVDEETERYDQPVLIRLNTRDEDELRSGFPKNPEDLFGFHAIILDDIEAEFFTQDQMLLLQRFASERGGGVLMLGGADSFQDGKYARTPIGDMLPIYLDRGGQELRIENAKIELSREGWLEPWVRLRQTEQEERTRLESLPGHKVVNQLPEVKPGATVLATAVASRGQKYPALVVQRFGNGRTAAITLGDLWRAGLQDEKKQKDLGKLWRQVARWLIADVPPQIEIRVASQSADAASAVSLVVHARDKKFDPLDNATVELAVQGPSGGETNTIRFTAEPSETEAGVYHGVFVPRETGPYLATARVTDADGVHVGSVDVGWASEPLAREFERLAPNESLLQDLARQTGGEMVPIARLEQFVESLPSKKAPIIETYSSPLWHRPSIFLLALGCFVAEWGLRRWKGLA